MRPRRLELVARLRALDERASMAPWQVELRDGEVGPEAVIVDLDGEQVATCPAYVPHERANAELIVELRNGLAELLDEVERPDCAECARWRRLLVEVLGRAGEGDRR